MSCQRPLVDYGLQMRLRLMLHLVSYCVRHWRRGTRVHRRVVLGVHRRFATGRQMRRVRMVQLGRLDTRAIPPAALLLLSGIRALRQIFSRMVLQALVVTVRQLCEVTVRHCFS